MSVVQFTYCCSLINWATASFTFSRINVSEKYLLLGRWYLSSRQFKSLVKPISPTMLKCWSSTAIMSAINLLISEGLGWSKANCLFFSTTNSRDTSSVSVSCCKDFSPLDILSPKYHTLLYICQFRKDWRSSKYSFSFPPPF